MAVLIQLYHKQDGKEHSQLRKRTTIQIYLSSRNVVNIAKIRQGKIACVCVLDMCVLHIYLLKLKATSKIISCAYKFCGYDR